MEKKKKKHDEIVLLAKTKLNSIGVLICRALIDSLITAGIKKYKSVIEGEKNMMK